MTTKPTEFNLINNAKDSLRHAVEHLTVSHNPPPEDLKYAIRDVAHVVELLLKERLKNTHTAFMYQNIDKYKSKGAFTVDTKTAINRLLIICNIDLDESAKKTIEACRDIRNDIEHFEFRIDTKEAKYIIGRMLSFIFDFSKKHLSLDLEKEFKSDDRWESLIDMHGFWKAHGERIEKELAEKGIPTTDCPACGANTFDPSTSPGECHLCGHSEYMIECDYCHTMYLESELTILKGNDGDAESGITETETAICEDCRDSIMAEKAASESLADELKGQHNDMGK